MGLDSLVGIATGRRLDDRGWIPSKQKWSFAAFTAALEAIKTPVQWVKKGVSVGVKQPEREAEHSSPCTSEAEYGEGIPPLAILLHSEMVFLIKFSVLFTFIYFYIYLIFKENFTHMNETAQGGTKHCGPADTIHARCSTVRGFSQSLQANLETL